MSSIVKMILNFSHSANIYLHPLAQSQGLAVALGRVGRGRRRRCSEVCRRRRCFAWMARGGVERTGAWVQLKMGAKKGFLEHFVLNETFTLSKNTDNVLDLNW